MTEDAPTREARRPRAVAVAAVACFLLASAFFAWGVWEGSRNAGGGWGIFIAVPFAGLGLLLATWGALSGRRGAARARRMGPLASMLLGAWLGGAAGLLGTWGAELVEDPGGLLVSVATSPLWPFFVTLMPRPAAALVLAAAVFGAGGGLVLRRIYTR